jgi:hypothetical protein
VPAGDPCRRLLSVIPAGGPCTCRELFKLIWNIIWKTGITETGTRDAGTSEFSNLKTGITGGFPYKPYTNFSGWFRICILFFSVTSGFWENITKKLPKKMKKAPNWIYFLFFHTFLLFFSFVIFTPNKFVIMFLFSFFFGYLVNFLMSTYPN